MGVAHLETTFKCPVLPFHYFLAYNFAPLIDILMAGLLPLKGTEKLKIFTFVIYNRLSVIQNLEPSKSGNYLTWLESINLSYDKHRDI